MTGADERKPHWNESPLDFSLRHDAEIIRGPVEWSLDMTNECVGACRHCFNRSGTLERDELTDDEMTAVARQIAALEPLGICLCGGEPLLRLDLVCELASIIGAAGTSVSLVTNGMLMTESAAARLKRSSIHSVQVSLDGSRAETHEKLRVVPGSFESAVAAIKILRNADITVGVAFSPTSFNISEFSEVHELCRTLGVFEMRAQPLMPLGECNLDYESLAPSEAQYDDLVLEYKRIAASPDPGLKIEWGDPVDHLIRFAQFYMMVPYMMHITADGFLVPTVYLPVRLGNVRRHAVSEYWAAGLNKAWQIPIMREMAYRIRCNRDFRFIRPQPNFEAHIDYDLIDRTPEEKELMTRAVLEFLERFDQFRDRPGSLSSWKPQSRSVRTFASSLLANDPLSAGQATVDGAETA